MTPEEHIKRFEKTINDLTNHNNGTIMVKLGVSALTLIKERVIETGVNAKGSKFPGYSTKDMLIGAKSARTKEVENLLFGSKKKRAAMDWVTLGGNRYSQMLSESAGTSVDLKRLAILKGGYKKLRQLWGLPANYVNFSVTNRMWNDINIVSNMNSHRGGEVIIGARLESEKQKLAGNTKRKGDILDLNAKEIEDLKRTYNLNALQVFRSNGL